jgi:hypothetical protein
MLNYLFLKCFVLGDKVLKFYLLTFWRTKLTVVLLWMLLMSMYPLGKLEAFLPLTSVISQELELQQGVL